MPNPYLLLGTLVGALLLAVSAFFAGHHYATLQEQKAIAAAEARAIEVTQAQDAVTRNADVAAAQARVKIVTQIKTITKEVPVYVTKKADAACALTRGTIRVLNDSAANLPSIPGPTGQSDDAPAGVELHTVVGTVVGNYGTYQQVAAQLVALQNWVRAEEGLRR